MHRFFVTPASIKNGQVNLSAEQTHQISRVLRLREGEVVAILDNAGWLYEVELSSIGASESTGIVRRRHLAPGEPRTKVTLYPSLLKSDKLELVFQKCTELGVTAFSPLISDRCNIGSISDEKFLRWERIIAEAAEQSERGRLPQLHPIAMFEAACEQARGVSFVALERGERPGLRSETSARLSSKGLRPFSINLFVGPEGGYSDGEVELARSYGIVPVSLGPRILRAETASIVGATLLLASAGELD